MEPIAFLNLVYGEAIDAHDGWLLVWTSQDKRSAFFNNLARAAEYIAARAKIFDVYLGLGLRREPLPPNRRGGKESISAICAFGIDIDVAGDAHTDEHRPTRSIAIERIEQLDPKPTLVIDSGHGYHCWYVFKKPLLLTNDTDRNNAEQAARELTARIRAHVAPYSIDSTWDLARVLRAPGTYNHKLSERKPVFIISADGPPYSLPQNTPLTQLPERVQNLIAMSTEWQNWWQKNLMIDDQSLSGYDMYLVRLGLTSGLDRATIERASLIMRSIHGTEKDVEKAKRKDYWDITFQKVQNGQPTKPLILEHIDKPETADYAEQLKFLEQTLALPSAISRIVRRGGVSEQSWYLIELQDGRVIRLGQGKDFSTAQQLRTRLVDAGIPPSPAIRNPTFPIILQTLCACAVSDVIPQAELGTQLNTWIADCIDNLRANNEEELQELAASKRCFLFENYQYISVPTLKRFIYNEWNVPYRPDALYIELRALGFEQCKVNVTTFHGRTSYTYWRRIFLPDDRTEP